MLDAEFKLHIFQQWREINGRVFKNLRVKPEAGYICFIVWKVVLSKLLEMITSFHPLDELKTRNEHKCTQVCKQTKGPNTHGCYSRIQREFKVRCMGVGWRKEDDQKTLTQTVWFSHNHVITKMKKKCMTKLRYKDFKVSQFLVQCSFYSDVH